MIDPNDPLLHRCREAMLGQGGASPSQVVAAYVPGRIEVLGKHTDYAGGRSLTMPIDRGFRMVGRARNDDVVRMVPVDGGLDEAEFTLGRPADAPPGHWLHYPATTARRISRNFADATALHGADIAFASDLPPAAGMSSSSAFMVAAFLVLSRLNALPQTRPYRENLASLEDLAMYLACVENGQSFGTLTGEAGVGTFGGSEDHTAILCGRPGRLSLFSYAPTRFERAVAWPAGMAMVVATCGVSAEKTGARREDYNRVSRRARAVVEAYDADRGTRHRHLRDLSVTVGDEGLLETLATLNRLESRRPELARMHLASRFEQFYREDQQIIPEAADVLGRGDVKRFGELCDLSQAQAEAGLENQIPQTVALQRLARQLGAAAASAFGAGFGGSVWAMVPADGAERFAQDWLAAYRKPFPEDAARAEAFATRPSMPAGAIDVGASAAS